MKVLIEGEFEVNNVEELGSVCGKLFKHVKEELTKPVPADSLRSDWPAVTGQDPMRPAHYQPNQPSTAKQEDPYYIRR